MGQHSDTSGSLALTPVQEGMVFHQLTSGRNSGVDIEQIICELRHSLDVGVFQQSWQALFDQNRELISHVDLESSSPQLVSTEDHSCEIVFLDWSNDPEKEGALQKRFEDFLDSDRQLGFDIGESPMFRIHLIKLADDWYRCVWSFHHLLMDGRSFALALTDVFIAYDTLMAGESLKKDIRPSRRAYLSWQEEHNWSTSIPYWKTLLSDIDETSTLRPAASGVENPGELSPRAETEFTLSESDSRMLEEWATQHDVTVNAIVQSAWAVLHGHYGGSQSVVFGTTRSGRQGTVADSDKMIGVFITTVPVRVNLADVTAEQLVRDIRKQHIDVREHEHTPLAEIQGTAGVRAGSNLFETLIVYDRRDLDLTIHDYNPDWTTRQFSFRERTPYPFTLYVFEQPQLAFKLAYDTERLSPPQAKAVLNHLSNLIHEIVQKPDIPVMDLAMVSESEYDRLSIEYNDTSATISEACIHHLIEKQYAMNPDTECLVSGGSSVTNRELYERSGQIAVALQKLGVKHGGIVGVCMDRSIDMVASIIAVMRTGAAYVPLDPDYPVERVSYCLSDSGADVLVTTSQLASQFNDSETQLLLTDTLDRNSANTRPTDVDVGNDDLAYVIYTSGSTGAPKGVMIEHRNAVNFFAGMDNVITAKERKKWLAVTSLAFDISVLELLWTLTRGYTVVLAGGADSTSETTDQRRRIGFSLFYFASDPGGVGREKYQLVLKGAEFADQHGFDAIWTPERHFHAFGGLYPNPSVIGAAVAAITKNIGIRAGSVVLPLHHPLRVVEEWALVDNLSNGKVGLSFASGWQPNDFVLAPDRYEKRRESLYDDIETVRSLWRGESMRLKNPKGDMVDVKPLPRPVQAELPIWVTAAGSPDTFRQAGAIGANLLTHLLGQTLDEVREKIDIYRQAWRDNGHGANGGHVSLMLHTMIGTDNDEVRAQVREPMKNYLRSAASLVAQYADAWTAYKQGSTAISGTDFKDLNDEEMESLLDFAFERYFETSALFGTPEKCTPLVESVHAAGVDEIACLIDFGVEHQLVLDNLKNLNSLKIQSHRRVAATSISLSDLICEHDISHVQCTPSGARTILNEERSTEALGRIDQMLVGGEAFSPDLWKSLGEKVVGDVVNMYGPTETTIWSTTSSLKKDSDVVPIGTPIANTQCYVLDESRRLVPEGIPGELYIAGDGVARGYYDREALTGERFVQDTFAKSKTATMYRTGDVVCRDHDGVLHFLGRVDHQVKIRGFRVELGEIEIRLADYDAIEQAVVVAHSGMDGIQQLVAYCKPSTGDEVVPQSVAAHLAKSLPDYMIPSQILPITEFPLTPNRKIDRNNLPDPAEMFKERTVSEPTAPPSELEETIKQVWESVLGLSPISVRDNFFDIGGHSLRAVQVQNQLRSALNIRVPITDLFRFPTIEAFAANLQGQTSATGEAGISRAKQRRAARGKKRGRNT